MSDDATVVLRLTRGQAEAIREELRGARVYWGEMLGDAQDGLAVIDAALAAPAADTGTGELE